MGAERTARVAIDMTDSPEMDVRLPQLDDAPSVADLLLPGSSASAT